MPKKPAGTGSLPAENCVICLTANKDVTNCSLDHYIYGKPPMLILDLISFCVPEFVSPFYFMTLGLPGLLPLDNPLTFVCSSLFTFCLLHVLGTVLSSQGANVLGVHHAVDSRV